MLSLFILFVALSSSLLYMFPYKFEFWFVRFISFYIHIHSFGFLGPCCSLWGSFWIPSCGYPCARFGPLLLSFWNQDSYSWLKLPIFGCIQFLYNLEPRGRSPWWYFPIVKTCFPFLEQCGQYLTCDCYMLEKEFRNHPLHALRRNLLSFH